VNEVLNVLSHFAIKYREEYKRVPVLIIDDVNRLARKQQKILNLFQDYAKEAADNGIITVVFMSNEGVPCRMTGKLTMFVVIFWLLCANKML